MGDSLPTFDDLEYTGLTDTADGFSGSSTLQDVQLGSPVLLDSTYGPTDSAVTDLVGGGNPFSMQSLSGISDPPFASASQSTPTPSVSQPNPNSAAGLSALAKFGASIASLMAGPAPAQAGARPATMSPAGGALLPGAASGTSTLLLLVVVGALVLLLLRSE